MVHGRDRNLVVTDADSEKLQGHINEFNNGVFAFAIVLGRLPRFKDLQ